LGGGCNLGGVAQLRGFEGGKPRKAPIETLMTIIDCISVLPISGITEVKIPPMRRKKIIGTI